MLERLLKKPINLSRNRQIGRKRPGSLTQGTNLVSSLLRVIKRVLIVHHHIPSRPRESEGNGPADSFAGTSD
jgi:hypothetical protein